MAGNPIPIILILVLLKNRGGFHQPSISSLELESFLDNAHSMLNALEKISGFAQSGLANSLPDMKKILEIVEKFPM